MLPRQEYCQAPVSAIVGRSSGAPARPRGTQAQLVGFQTGTGHQAGMPNPATLSWQLDDTPALLRLVVGLSSTIEDPP